MHKKEGLLRAYLDNQVSAEEAQTIEAHLKTCGICRQRLATLRLRGEMAASAVSALREPSEGAETSTYRAFARLQSRIGNEAQPRRSVVTMWNRMTTRRWRAAWATVAALLVVSLFVLYPPLRTAASEFLGVFRVRKFAAIPVNLSALENNPTFANILETALSDQVEVTRAPGPLTSTESAEEASALAGFAVRLPTWLPGTHAAPPAMRVADETAYIRSNLPFGMVNRRVIVRPELSCWPGW